MDTNGGVEMLSDTIKARLINRFSAPLPEFHKRRIVFWNERGISFYVDSLYKASLRKA